jgi:hypothetical protein
MQMSIFEETEFDGFRRVDKKSSGWGTQCVITPSHESRTLGALLQELISAGQDGYEVFYVSVSDIEAPGRFSVVGIEITGLCVLTQQSGEIDVKPFTVAGIEE